PPFLFLLPPPLPTATLFPYTTLFRSQCPLPASPEVAHSLWLTPDRALQLFAKDELPMIFPTFASLRTLADFDSQESVFKEFRHRDRKSTRLNSSHVAISYAVFCLKKK